MVADRLHPVRRRVPAVALGAAVLALGALALTPVPGDRTALVLRLGSPVRVINAAGTDQAGLAWRLPLLDRVVWLDRRVLMLPLDDTQVTTRDGHALDLDAWAAWRVTDPARFYQALGTPEQAGGTLRAILASVLRQALARMTAADATALMRGQGTEALRAAFDRELSGYGAGVVDLRLARLVPPDGAPMDAAMARMAADAGAQGAAITAEGERQARTIRADAEARAGAIYAASFGKDPEFYDFYRAMQSYDAAFAQKGGHTAIVLSPDSAYLRQFRGK
jgi:modulator of FtsH protease HflC